MAERIPELLAPAGGPPQFNAALAAGADAIYCGFGTSFNARRGAQSFTSKTFADACRKAHVAGAKVYVTVNVAIRSDEIPSVLALVRRAWLLGADAFIIQDWGLLHEVRKRWPEVECHVSTQANVHDTRGVAWCRDLGVQRVTLSRELSLGEIRLLAEEEVDLECFCHGAICICYSGVCMMSSSAGDRSANRGTCAQPCRLPYELVDECGRVLSSPERGRPLCPKDFCAFEDLQEMMDAGARSLKIEGRLKSPDYIASVVGAYREQLDNIAAGTKPSAGELDERRTRLKRAFNRDFTSAYLYDMSGDELMSYERSNNRGQLVGKVVGSRSFGSVKVRRGGKGGGRERLRTVQVAEVDIRLDSYVERGDLLEVRPLGDPSQFLTTYVQQDASAAEVITCKTTREMECGSLVRVIRSQRAMDLGSKTAELSVPRKRPVHVRICAQLGKPFEVELSTVDGLATARAQGSVVEPARTRAITRDDLVEHVGRMGGSSFDPVSFDVRLDEGCGMGFSMAHGVRSQACELLERSIVAEYERRSLAPAPSRETILRDLNVTLGPKEDVEAQHVEVCAIVTSSEAAHAARRAGAQRVYATADAMATGNWPEWVIPSLDEVCREKDHERLDPWVKSGRPVAVGNVSELVLARKRGAMAEIRGCIPVHNESCMAALEIAGARGIWLSPELSLEEIRQLAEQARIPLGLVVSGRIRAMMCEHCVLQVAEKCVHDCAACGLRKRKMSLRNGAGDLFPVRTDLQGRSRVYSSRPLDLVPLVPDILEAGVRRLAADCTLLSAGETTVAVHDIVNAVEAVQAGIQPRPRQKGSTSGHLLDPIA